MVRILRKADSVPIAELAKRAQGARGVDIPLDVSVLARWSSDDHVVRRLSGEYFRFGLRRIRTMLGRKGIVVRKERRGRLRPQTVLHIPRRVCCDAIVPKPCRSRYRD